MGPLIVSSWHTGAGAESLTFRFKVFTYWEDAACRLYTSQDPSLSAFADDAPHEHEASQVDVAAQLLQAPGEYYSSFPRVPWPVVASLPHTRPELVQAANPSLK